MWEKRQGAFLVPLSCEGRAQPEAEKGGDGRGEGCGERTHADACRAPPRRFPILSAFTLSFSTSFIHILCPLRFSPVSVYFIFTLSFLLIKTSIKTRKLEEKENEWFNFCIKFKKWRWGKKTNASFLNSSDGIAKLGENNKAGERNGGLSRSKVIHHHTHCSEAGRENWYL